MTASNASEANKALVLAGIKGAFIDRDPAVLDRLFRSDYHQHNPLIANGTAAIKAIMAGHSPDFRYEPGLVVADGEYVIHGRYTRWARSRWLRSIYSASPMARLQNTGMSCRKRSQQRKAPMAIACSRVSSGDVEHEARSIK